MIPYPSLVRRATPADIDALLLFVPQVLAETTLLPISHVKVERLIERCASQQNGAIAGIIDGEEGIDAGIGMAFFHSETSDIPYVKCVWCGLHPSVRKQPANPKDPRAHYGRTLFEFARWCHERLEQAAGHQILLQFDLLTLTMLGPKMALYQRNLQQVGAAFAFGTTGNFVSQPVEALNKQPVPA